MIRGVVVTLARTSTQHIAQKRRHRAQGRGWDTVDDNVDRRTRHGEIGLRAVQLETGDHPDPRQTARTRRLGTEDQATRLAPNAGEEVLSFEDRSERWRVERTRVAEAPDRRRSRAPLGGAQSERALIEVLGESGQQPVRVGHKRVAAFLSKDWADDPRGARIGLSSYAIDCRSRRRRTRAAH